MAATTPIYLLNIWFWMANAEAPNSTTATEMFRDGFNNGPPDKSKWYIFDGISDSAYENDIIFSKHNVAVHNGTLQLRTGNQTFASTAETKKFSPPVPIAGMVRTGDKFNFGNGQIEFKAKMASGADSQISLYNPNCTMEKPHVDGSCTPEILFFVDADKPTEVECRVRYFHYTSRNDSGKLHKVNRFHKSDQDLSMDYHIYKLIWINEILFWLIDDNPVHCFVLSLRQMDTMSWPKLQIMLFVLPSPRNGSRRVEALPTGPAVMSIDYVAVSRVSYDPLKITSMIQTVLLLVAADIDERSNETQKIQEIWPGDRNNTLKIPLVSQSITFSVSSAEINPLVQHSGTTGPVTVLTFFWWICVFASQL